MGLQWYNMLNTLPSAWSWAIDGELGIKFIIHNRIPAYNLKLLYLPGYDVHIEFNVKPTDEEIKNCAEIFREIFRELLREFKQPFKTLCNKEYEYMKGIEEILLLLDMGGVVI